MERLSYRIGGELIEIFSHFPLLLQKSLHSFPVFETSRSKEDAEGENIECKSLQFYVNEDPDFISKSFNSDGLFADSNKFEIIHEFETMRARCIFARDICKTSGSNGDEFFLLIKDRTVSSASVIAVMNRHTLKTEIKVYSKERLNSTNLIFAIWFGLSFCGASLGLLAIHASAVEYKGGAVIFLGESGTGKSTHTTLWTRNIDGSSILNDDSPLIKIQRDSKYLIPRVYGSPWSGKGRCYRNKDFHLKAVVRLQQHSSNEIIRLNNRDSFTALFPSFPPALLRERRSTDYICSLISQLIQSTPVFNLRCLPDKSAALLVCNAIYGR